MSGCSLWGNNANVTMGDQITRPLELHFFTPNTTTSAYLTQATSINDRTITVDSVAIFSTGDFITILSDTGGFFQAEITSIDSLVLSLDTPLDTVFQVGDEVISLSRDMDVNASPASPKIFGVRGKIGKTDLPVWFDITKIIGYMVTDALPDYNTFGDIAGGLTNGLVLRKHEVNNKLCNFHNIKTNGQIALHSGNLTILEETKAPKINGIHWEMDFAGQHNHGVAIRIKTDENLEYVIADDLSSLLKFRMIAVGHIVKL